MNRHFRAVLAGVVGLSSLALAAEKPAAARRPKEFAIIFLMGYAGDHLPKDPASFEKLVVACKQAHYNTVLCRYEPWRAKICRKHGMKIMPDLLAGDHHVYKSVDKARALCESLRDSDVVYAYHLWSDRVGGTVAGRSRDIKNVQQWDPNHATYVGDYHARAIGSLVGPDLIGYYDFHWKRLGHFRHLTKAWAASRKTCAPWLKYADGAPGRIGAGNYNRVLYTISTSIAFGLKGYMYHYVGSIDPKTWQWKTLGKDLQRVNAEVVRMGPELMRIGAPRAVYSTPITKTAKDRPTGQAKPTVPAGLTAIPADAPLQVVKGEAIVGVFRHADGAGAVVFANHNGYQPQSMRVTLKGNVKSAALLDRRTGTYSPLKLTGGAVEFEIPPAACELIKIER